MPSIIGMTGWDRSNAYTCDFSSPYGTNRPLGRVVVEPEDVDDLGYEHWIGRQLEPIHKVRLSLKRRQILPMLDFDSPALRALDARDQCVALAGFCSSVATITSSTLSTRIDGGRSSRGSSTRPSRRSARNRERHFPTVAADHPN